MNHLSLSKDIVALVPAAGIGSRMQTTCPKQYLTIGQYTVLEYSIETLLVHPRIKKVVVILSKDDNWFDTLPIARNPHIFQVTGGKTRAESVLAGLHAMPYSDWVLIHDAARPCMHLDDLTRLLETIKYNKLGAVLGVPVFNTIKRCQPGKTIILETIKRDNLWNALTPQLFPYKLLITCLTKALSEGANITDESSALEYCEYYPELVKGRTDNIKVTQLEDLALASFYLNQINLKESK